MTRHTERAIASPFGPRALTFFVLNAAAIGAAFLREIVLAWKLGVSRELDVYVALLSVHTFAGQQVGGVLLTAIVTTFASRLMFDTQRRLLASIFTFSTCVTAAAAIATYFLVSSTIGYLFPEFTEGQIRTAGIVLPLMIACSVLTSIAMAVRGIQHIRGMFWPGFSTGLIVSGSIIAIAILVARVDAIVLTLGLGLGWAIVVCLNVSLLAPLDSPSRPNTADVRVLWSAFLPLLVGEVLYQGVYLAERHFASIVGAGSLSVWAFAMALINVCQAIALTPLTIIMLPTMVRAFESDHASAMRLFWRLVVAVSIGSTIVAVLLGSLAEDIVRIVFERGRFSSADTESTASVMSVLAISLPLMSVGALMRDMLAATRDYRAAWLVNAIRFALLVSIGTWMTQQHGLQGLAWATVISVASGPPIMVYRLVLAVRRQRRLQNL